jgi:putative drug exporter of the RND superfamily
MITTLLPALLLLLGNRVNWPRAPRTSEPDPGSWWSRWPRSAMARPWLYLIPGLVVLGVFIAPAARLEPWNVGARDLTPEMEARRGYEHLERDFAAGWMGPVSLLVTTPQGGAISTPEQRRALGEMHARLADDRRVALVKGAVSDDGRAASLYLVPRASPESDEVQALVRELRGTSWADARDAGLKVSVGGFTAAIMDFDAEMFGSLRRVIPLVLVTTFLILMIAFRSIVVPLKAIAMNLLSVLAAYGFLVYLFQDGIGAGLIGLDPPGGINSFIVLMLFTILFGLSMDYEVFLLDRIQEEYRRTGDNALAVVRGLARTGPLITSAALIMVVLFGSFGFTQLTATREFGLGLAFAVAIDAALIRVVIAPILMGLMGRANWWFPGRRRSGAIGLAVPATAELQPPGSYAASRSGGSG